MILQLNEPQADKRLTGQLLLKPMMMLNLVVVASSQNYIV